MSATVLLTRAAGEDKMPALLSIILPALHEFFVTQLARGHDEKRIPAEILVIGDDIDGTPKPFQRAVLFQDVTHGVPTHRLFVVINVPSALDVIEQRGAAGGVRGGFLCVRL